MAQSGWYADPDGTPDRLRYWDGTQWTTNTMPDPQAHPGPAPAPQPHPQPSQPVPPQAQPYPLPPQPRQPQTSGPARPPLPTRPARRNPLLTFVPILVIVGVLWAINGLFTRTPEQPRSPVTTSSSPRPLPTSFPTISNPPVTAPTIPPVSGSPSVFPSMPECPPPTASRLTDGTVTVPVPSGWEVGIGTDDLWQCQVTAGREVVSGWYTGLTVASAPAQATTPAQHAQAIWDQNLATGYGNPSKVTKVTLGEPEAVTVGGLSGVRLAGTIAVTGVGDVEGDTVQILVLAKGGRLSTVMTVHTTNDPQAPAEMKLVWDGLRVDG